MRIPFYLLAALLLAPALVTPRQTLAQEVAKPSAPTEIVPTDAGLPPVRRIGGAVSAPVVLHHVEPKFSEQARAAFFSGRVLVTLIVDTKGMPQNVHVLRGVGMGLDENAVEAVKQYVFQPAMEGGKPVAVELSVEINFEIYRPPTVIHSAAIHITDEARRNKASGAILVAFTLDEQGLPQDLHILHGFGMGMDEAAIEAVKKYKFAPFLRDGQVVALPTRLEIKFQAK
jgi:TonB family protein